MTEATVVAQDPALTQQVILAAINMTGPADQYAEGDTPYNLALLDNVAAVAATLTAGGRAYKRAAGVLGAKVFVGVVTRVSKERSSGRGVIVLKTRVTDRNPEGEDRVRTEIAKDEGSEGLAMIARFVALKGHRVRVFVEMQKTQNPNKPTVRIVQWVEDLGLAEPDED